MTNKGLNTKVSILGQEYRIIGEEEKYLQEIAGFVDRNLRELQENTSCSSSGRLCLLACLNIADQLQKLKNGHKDMINHLLDAVNKIIGGIDSHLSGQEETSFVEISHPETV